MSNQGVGSAKSFSANGRPSPGCREAAEVVLDGEYGVAQDASSLGLAPPRVPWWIETIGERKQVWPQPFDSRDTRPPSRGHRFSVF
jgi:hypothetical protein